MLIDGVGGRREEELARHLQVEDERPAPLAGNEDHLPPAPHSQDVLPRQKGEPGFGRPAEKGRKKKANGTDLGPLESGGKPADDGLDLGELGHGAIVLDLRGVFD
jgi:hypothetical protein